MKRLSDQNYYEILEIPHRATWGEIQKAYELAKKTYGPDSIASYSLFDPGDRDVIVRKIEEAYRTLIDEQKRKVYDETLGGAAPEDAGRSAPTPEIAEPTPTDDAVLAGEINGKVLKQLRERRGISLQDIADRTRISITYLGYMEEENFNKFPADVYLKSYLSQYAKVLQLDINLIVDGYFKMYRIWQRENQKEKKE